MASTPARLNRTGNVSWVSVYGVFLIGTYEDENGKYSYHREQIAEGIGLIATYDEWKKSKKGYTRKYEYYKYLADRITHHHRCVTSEY